VCLISTPLKIFNWSTEKNEWLKENRGISFEEIVFYIAEDNLLLDVVQNSKYPQQKNFIIQVDSYAYIVPFVENDEEIFLKTAFPSRKATKYYLNL